MESEMEVFSWSGAWERVQTDAGWHLRLRNSDGEPVLLGMPLSDPDEVMKVAMIVHASSCGGMNIREVDERTVGAMGRTCPVCSAAPQARCRDAFGQSIDMHSARAL